MRERPTTTDAHVTDALCDRLTTCRYIGIPEAYIPPPPSQLEHMPNAMTPSQQPQYFKVGQTLYCGSGAV